METKIEKPETLETEQTVEMDKRTAEYLREAKRREAKIAIAVGLALLRTNLDRDKSFTDDYVNALLDSPWAMSLINKIPKAYTMTDDDWLAEMVRQMLRTQGQTEDESESADVTPLVAVAKDQIQAYTDGDDDRDLLRVVSYAFAAGRLSREAEYDNAQYEAEDDEAQ